MNLSRKSTRQAFTLVEVLISMTIAAMTIGAIATGFAASAVRAEWSGYSLAAHRLALQGLEQTRAAKWDPSAYPPIDHITAADFPPTLHTLDIPVSGGNPTWATNTFSISMVSTNPALKLIRVDCTWAFATGRRAGLFTNTVSTLRAPDQ